jgi:antitoxin YefM
MVRWMLDGGHDSIKQAISLSQRYACGASEFAGAAQAKPPPAHLLWRSGAAHCCLQAFVVREPLVPYLVLRRNMAITASEARKNLFPLIEQVNNDRTPVEIMSRRGDAVLISRADYQALEETAHLLRSPANARRLLESLAQAQRGEREEHPLAR